MYQPGDFVLLCEDTGRPRRDKLSPHYTGPYMVITQIKNDVSCRHLASGVTSVLHVEKLKRYVGSHAQAKEAANAECDQYDVDCILGYRGDPSRRSDMEFELLFRAGDTLWKRYCKDIYVSVYFEEFCRARPKLRRLLTSESDSKAQTALINKTPITSFQSGDSAS